VGTRSRRRQRRHAGAPVTRRPPPSDLPLPGRGRHAGAGRRSLGIQAARPSTMICSRARTRSRRRQRRHAGAPVTRRYPRLRGTATARQCPIGAGTREGTAGHFMTLPERRERRAFGKTLGGRAVQPAAPVDAWLGRA
jgi:hypothetical protein